MFDLLKSPALRLLGYFAVVAALLVLAWSSLPSVHSYIEISGLRGGSSLQGFNDAFSGQGQGAPTPEERSMPQYAILSFLAIASTVVFTPPVAWIYMVTKRQEGYDQTFVQVLILLPLVVAAVVRVVQGDLALAFALAGIVAAVRFRTTLKDLKNAVFAFASIGIGLACGTGNWLLAGFLSLFFSLVTYTLWARDFGSVREMLSPLSKPMRLSEALVPGETQRSVVAGSRRYAKDLVGDELEHIGGYTARLLTFVRGDALRSEKKYDTLLIVYTDEPDSAVEKLKSPLNTFAERSDLVDTLPGPGHSAALVYLLRLSEEAEIGDFIGMLKFDERGIFKAAELKPISGLRKQLK